MTLIQLIAAQKDGKAKIQISFIPGSYTLLSCFFILFTGYTTTFVTLKNLPAFYHSGLG